MDIADMGFDDCEVSLEPAFLNVMASVKFRDRLTFGQFGSEACRGVECGNPCATRPNAFGERSLRNQFKLDLAGKVLFRECPGIRRAGKRADHLLDHAGINHRGDADPCRCRRCCNHTWIRSPKKPDKARRHPC